MIPISLIQSTAETLMDKAAIEIPQDYLDGFAKAKRPRPRMAICRPSFCKAMLENYEAAKEDRRAMCGDTGVPRWFVKMGNEAQVEGGMVALEAGTAPLNGDGDERSAAATEPGASAVADRP